jgi:dihydrofolate synthase/folylpolyglutamate synthase
MVSVHTLKETSGDLLSESVLMEHLCTRFPSVFFPMHPTQGHRDPEKIVCEWQKRFRVLHSRVSRLFLSGQSFGQNHVAVAGTSGKGSVTRMLGAALAEHGCRVGMFVSPHLLTLRERFAMFENSSVREVLPTLQEVFELSEQVATLDTPESPFSLFEALFMMAGLHFQKQRCDWVVWEVGCGGRLDAVNTLPHKALALMTRIGLDHQDLLGETIEAIATEKAPIFDRADGIGYSPQKPEVLEILERQRQTTGCLRVPPHRYEVWTSLDSLGVLNVKTPRGVIATSLRGKGQHHNWELAMDAACHLGVSQEAIERATRRLYLKGRIEVVSQKPGVIVDVAHNPEKMQQLVDILGLWRRRPVVAVVAFSEQKNTLGMLQVLGEAADKLVLTEFKSQQGRRPQPLVLLREQSKQLGVESKISVCSSVGEAAQQGLGHLSENGLLVFTGSVFLYREAIQALTRAGIDLKAKSP